MNDTLRYEHVARYTNCRLDFMGIPNIHVVRDSWLKLKELLTDETKKLDDNRWRSALERYVTLSFLFSIKPNVSAAQGGINT